MTSAPKVLIVGSGSWPWYQSACTIALRELGCSVEEFSWFDDYCRWKDGYVEPVYKSTWAKVENHVLAGPITWRMNRRLIRFAKRHRPDVIWFYNATHIFSQTVRKLKEELPNCVLAQYANDNPFTRRSRPDYWRHFKHAISYCDVHFIYRHENEADLRAAGAQGPYLLRSYFIPEDDYRVELGRGDGRFHCDVLFAGHYEGDGRLRSLEAIAGAGYRLNLFGGGWAAAEKQLGENSPLVAHFPVDPVVGQDYRKAISGAKIALCFLSKLNADSYTRRNFQIPAMRTFMLSEYSGDLAGLFQEGVEAEYFRSREELMDKIDYYLRNEAQREQIAQRGYEHVVRDGHDVKSRMREFLDTIRGHHAREVASAR